MRARRRALSPEARARASEIICAKLAANGTIAVRTDPYDGDGAIAVYLASSEEIDLSGFIREMLARGVTVVSPRWNGETYELAKLKGLSERHLRRGPMNIREPAEAELVKPSDVAVWIVPGLVFTQDGKRIGYGGGWYDRLLAGAKSSVKIGVAHEFQIVDDLPHEPHDIQLTCVVTDSLSDRHIEFAETPEGFRALVTVDSLMARRVLFVVSLLGLYTFAALPLSTFLYVPATVSASFLPTWACTSILIAMVVFSLASIVALMRFCGGPDRGEIEVKGEEGVCRRRFAGLYSLRDIRFHWTPWTKAESDGLCFYSAPGARMVSVVTGAERSNLFHTYESAAVELAIRMNLSHRIGSERMAAAQDAVLTRLPRGMRIVRTGDSETMEVSVHSLTGIGSALGVYGLLGLVGTLVAFWLARWTSVLLVILPVLWGALLLAVAYHALWTLLGKHRLRIADGVCDYVAELGPRVKRRHFTLTRDSSVSCSAGRSLCIASAEDDCHYCFNDLPSRCYLPLMAFLQRHIRRSAP